MWGLRGFSRRSHTTDVFGVAVRPAPTSERKDMSNAQQKMNHVALAQAIKDSQETFLLRMELFAAVAAEMKAKYDALVTAGFTAEQALELCKSKAV